MVLIEALLDSKSHRLQLNWWLTSLACHLYLAIYYSLCHHVDAFKDHLDNCEWLMGPINILSKSDQWTIGSYTDQDFSLSVQLLFDNESLA